MIAPLLRLGLMTSFLIKYKKLIVLTLVIIIFITLIHYIHLDLKEYFNSQDLTQYLGYALLAKWLCIISTLLGYIWGFKYLLKPNHSQPNIKQSSNTSVPDPNIADMKNDPFEAIRHKAKLRSRSDFVLETKKKNKH
ncbi:hypothetical protein [Catenovulum maritimum]|uniref:Uncharacterized protein n=1 Tax=Catenovulum maritimum TaxID=1513271 RepID=A0A0J8GUN4_9ALTE|nr:hypothetical protein [Catenovulum maritimum]KMT66462.1 hypothetical protein XM47_02655 [Catenovulum maritimum]